MASRAFPSIAKTHKTSDGTNYGFVHIPAPSSSSSEHQTQKPTLLFIHGYPSSSYDWRHQIETFSNLGYGIIVPDLLGYGDTDKPSEYQAYDLRRVAGHVAEICDAVGAKSNVVAIAHDWGCGLLSSIVRRDGRGNRYAGFVFVAVGYLADQLGDLDQVNAMTEKMVGYPLFGYWKFHNQEDAAEVIGRNAEAYMSLVYPADPTYWKTDLCPIGKVRAWTESGVVRPLPAWLDKEEHALHLKIMQAGGWTGPLNWYNQAIAGVTAESEKSLTEDDKFIRKPVFFVGASKDYVCLEATGKSNTEQWAKAGVDTTSIDAGHWVYLEKRKEFDDALKGWLEKTFAGSAPKI